MDSTNDDSIKNYIDLFTGKVSHLTSFTMKCIMKKIWDENKYLDEPYTYLYTLLFKTLNSLDTSNVLLLNVLNKPTTTDGLYLICRTTLSDLILFEYLFRRSKDDEQLTNNIARLYCDHIYYQIDAMKTFYQAAYGKSPAEIEEEINKLKSTRLQCFDSTGTNKYDTRDFTVKKMSNYILSTKEKDEDLNNLIRARELYDVFSKFEHFGELTIHLTHRHFKNNRIEEVINEVVKSFKITVRYLDELTLLLCSKESKEYQGFNKM